MAGTFALDISRFVKNANISIQTATQKIAMEAFKRVILRSPVKLGRFRANWGCSVGSPHAGGGVNAFDPAGTATAEKAMQIVKAWNGQGSIFLCNNLPYSIRLEYGYSKQAPQGMVRLTVAEMGGVAEQVTKA